MTESKRKVADLQSDADCVAHLPTELESLEQYLQTMQIEKEILNLMGQSELNENLLDANVIPPKRADLWLDKDKEDPDCQIIEDARLEKPQPTPPLEDDRVNDREESTVEPKNLESLFTSPITLRQL